MRKLNEQTGKVEITTVREVDRYTPHIYQAEWYCDDVVNEIKNNCKIYVPRGDYSQLSNFDMDYDLLTGDLSADLETFQNELDEQFGSHKYEAFVLGAYVHSITAFSVNKSGNRVCPFDSSQLGFIGLPVDSNNGEFYYPDKVAEEWTNAWNGFYNEYQIYDELNEEIVDSCVSAETPSEWIESAEKTYHVSFDGVEPTY